MRQPFLHGGPALVRRALRIIGLCGRYVMAVSRALALAPFVCAWFS
jgi:hypothetical protein